MIQVNVGPADNDVRCAAMFILGKKRYCMDPLCTCASSKLSLPYSLEELGR